MDNWNLLKNMLIEEKALSQKETVSSVENTVIFRVVDKLISSTKIEKALRILDGAIQCQSGDPELYQKKSQILLEEGYVENAIDVLLKAHEIDQSNIDIILNIVDAFEVTGDFRGGLSFVDKCLSHDLNGLEIEVLLAKTNLLLCNDQAGLAYDLMVQMLFEYPNDAEVCMAFNKITSLEKLQSEAIIVLEDVIKANPYSEQAWYNLGHLYYYQCQFDLARMAYEYAFIIDPTMEKAYRHYVSVCHDTQSYRKALKVYSEMIERFTLTAADMAAIADCYISFEDYDRALKFLDHAIKKDAFNAEIYYKIAKIYSLKGTHSFCLNYINKAIRIDAENENYHLLKAEILYKLNNKPAAWENFNIAIDIDPMIESTWVGFIQMLIEEKDYEAALVTIGDAQVESGSTIFTYLTAVCFFGLKEEKLGAEALEEALIESFHEHEIIFELIPELQKNKKVKDMIAYYLFESE